MMPSKSGWKTHPLYTRVAIAGLLLYTLVTLLVAVLRVIDGEASTVGVFIISMALSVIFAGLMWRFGKWALVLAAVWGLLNLGLWGWPLIWLRYPNSFFNFALPLLLNVGALLALVGAIVAFVQQRRGTTRTSATRPSGGPLEPLPWSCWGLLFSRAACRRRGEPPYLPKLKPGRPWWK